MIRKFMKQSCGYFGRTDLAGHVQLSDLGAQYAISRFEKVFENFHITIRVVELSSSAREDLVNSSNPFISFK